MPADLFAQPNGSVLPPAHLQVVRASFQTTEPFNWELLQGFDGLRVLTYTASVQTVAQFLDYGYRDFECIFGCERVIGNVRDVVAVQNEVTKSLAKSARGIILQVPDSRKQRIIEAILDERARFRVVRDEVSHTKLYLLHSDSGKDGIHRRVLVGSANFSEQGLGGRQHESLVCFDDDHRAWEFYCGVYENIREQSTDELKLRELEPWVEENSKETTWRDVPVLESEQKTSEIRIRFGFADATSELPVSDQIEILKEAAADLPPELDMQTPPSSHGRILLPPAAKTRMRTVKVVRDPDKTNHSSFKLDVNRRIAWLDDKPWPLDWDREAAVHDAALLREYFAGFQEFSGNAAHLQKQYFILWAWYWFSPLLCDLRTRAQQTDGDLFQLPLYAIVFGASNCGKTSFVDTLATAMFGRPLVVDKAHFTRRQVRALQHNWDRLPIVFDDLGKTAFRTHGTELIKNELVRPASAYPGLLLSMNADLTSYPDEIVKRCLMIHTTASLPQHQEDRRRRLHARVAQCRAGLTTNLYRRWLCEVLDQLAEGPQPVDWLRLATNILAQLVSEGADSVPDWCRSMDWLTDYADHRHDQVRRRLQDHLRPVRYRAEDGTGEMGWTILDSDRLSVWESSDLFGRGDFSWEDVPSSLIDHDTSGRRRTILYRVQVEEFLGAPLAVPGQPRDSWLARFLNRR